MNISEWKVPQYTLPDPLVLPNGDDITKKSQWQIQRQRILNIFRDQVYGRVPDFPVETHFEDLSCSRSALGEQAIRKEIRITLKRGQKSLDLDLLIFLPNSASKRPVPVFMGMNFSGNHTIHPDPEISLSTKWIPDFPGAKTINHRATEADRGIRQCRWPIEKIIHNRFGLVTLYYGDLDPDFDDGFQNGIHALFYNDGQDRPASDEWGSISAWAWGLQRAMDYCHIDEQIDETKVALIGHSRLGKTALWAAAQDERFAAIIANNSGCMGAAISKRQFGETIEAINNTFPHWFCENFKKYNGNEEELEFDQHFLIALLAPRPVYIASAQNDLWADPQGEFLGLKHAGGVYQLFDYHDLIKAEMPDINQPVGNRIRYHIRPGDHDITNFDWGYYLNFVSDFFKSDTK